MSETLDHRAASIAGTAVPIASVYLEARYELMSALDQGGIRWSYSCLRPVGRKAQYGLAWAQSEDGIPLLYQDGRPVGWGGWLLEISGKGGKPLAPL